MDNKRDEKIEITQHFLEPNIELDVKASTSNEDVINRTLTYADIIPKNIANVILRRLANLTIRVNLNNGKNDTLVDTFQSNLPLRDENIGNDDEFISQLSTQDYHNEFKPKLLKSKPIYDTRVTKLQLKFLDEAMRPRENNFTRSAVINNKNDTFLDDNSGFKLKVKMSKKDEDLNHDNDSIHSYLIVNNDKKNIIESVHSKALGEKTNNTEVLQRRNVLGFNIESQSGPHFKTNTDHIIENENVQYLPVQYHVPILPQFQGNQAPLPPILPPQHSLPKFVPVYQSENMPMHFHAANPLYAAHLDTISQGNSQQNQIQNLENYFKLRDNNQYNELKGLERNSFDDENANAYLYQQFGIPVPNKHSLADEELVNIPSRSIYTDIGETRRSNLNKNGEFLDAHIKIPKNLFEQYQPLIIAALKDNIENKNTGDLITEVPQIRANVLLSRADDLKTESKVQVINSTNSFGIDTLVKSFLLDPRLAKEQTEHLFTKLISILGPEFSTYFGEKPTPAGNIDNEIKKLQNTLETLRKWREFSNNISSTKTDGYTTRLPIVNRTQLIKSISKESHHNNETQAPHTDSPTDRYKTIALNENVTTKGFILEFAEFLNTSNTMPKSVITDLETDVNRNHGKTTTLKPYDSKSNDPLQLEINKKDVQLQDSTSIIKKNTATHDEIKKSLDRFTMERKKTFTSIPRLEITPKAHYEEEQVGTKETQSNIVKNTDHNRTSTPHLGLIGKVLNENYLLLSQQSDKNKTTSTLPETIEIQGNDEDIIDAKYISENPEVFDSLRQQTEMMGKLLLNYEKNGGRKKNKAHNQQSKDNNMDDFEALINKLERDALTKNTNVYPVKNINNAQNFSTYAPKIANSHEKTISNNKKIKRNKEISTENRKSSIEFRAKTIKHTAHNKKTEKLRKHIHSKKNNGEEIATEKSTTKHSKENNDDEISTEKPSKEIPYEEVSNRNEKFVQEPTKTAQHKRLMSRSELKKALLRNPDLRKILRYCKLQKRKNNSTKRDF